MEHQEALQIYFASILKHIETLKKETTEIEISFDPEEKKALEYYLKDVAKRSVSHNLSIDECVYIASERIKRLIEGDKMEWDNLVTAIRANTDCVNRDNLIKFNKCFEHSKTIKV